MSVSATFFVLLRSHAYNLMAAEALRIVRGIHELGQHVGFHCAVPASIHQSEDVAALTELVEKDFAIVQRVLPFVQRVFAWHNTTPWLLDRVSQPQLAGLRNIYSTPFFRSPGVTYISDSVMRLSADELLERVSAAPGAVHLLLHPVHWVSTFSDPSQALSRAWFDVLRFAEKEMMPNPAYAARFPAGFTLPDLMESGPEPG